MLVIIGDRSVCEIYVSPSYAIGAPGDIIIVARGAIKDIDRAVRSKNNALG